MAGAANVTLGDGAWPTYLLKAPPMPALPLTDEIRQNLREAADEIARLAGPDNPVCVRLRALLGKLLPQDVTAGELAQRIDVTPRDVLDAAIAAGVRPFWHEGQQFRDAAYLRTYLRMQFHYDPVREVEFSLTPELAGRLAEELGVMPDELLADSGAPAAMGKSPRKFVGSESRLPDSRGTDQAGKRREQIG